MKKNVKSIFFETENGFDNIPSFELENGEIKRPYIKHPGFITVWLTNNELSEVVKQQQENKPKWWQFWK